ncbi:Phage-related capsid packaging protein [Salmonella enterica subsp. enterica serovar Alachua str. R6-377]|uniref:Phage-related capsid packaging protein n=1 Tax=Salmonella enterica subsp. enterica serovar Alachua str. R6-377 TaxID=913241 RepID=G5LKD9_SALET|nr:Phage-related capsid packaging protein [Salmonella enterica subsp. enterica serovar Alachua str. R6-377]
MGKSKKNRTAVKHSSGASAEAFSFGDPIPVLDRRELLDYVECVQMDRWYEPPVSFDGLARTYRAAVHHSSPIAVKRNILTSTFIPHPLLSQQAFSRFVQDYLVFGNAYLEKRTNRLGGILSLEPSLAKYTRRGIDLDTYWFVQYGMTTQPYQFTKGSIFHLMEPDLNQEIYGLPEYLSAIPSALLNESATLFRRKYYINGSHAGFIMYMTDAAQNQEDVNNIRQAMKSAKGPGNFRNLFMYSPNGKKDGIQIIPLSEVAAKDEFLNIKNVSRDDMMAAHRVLDIIMSSKTGTSSAAADDGDHAQQRWRIWGCGKGQLRLCTKRANAIAKATAGAKQLVGRRNNSLRIL